MCVGFCGSCLRCSPRSELSDAQSGQMLCRHPALGLLVCPPLVDHRRVPCRVGPQHVPNRSQVLGAQQDGWLNRTRRHSARNWTREVVEPPRRGRGFCGPGRTRPPRFTRRRGLRGRPRDHGESQILTGQSFRSSAKVGPELGKIRRHRPIWGDVGQFGGGVFRPNRLRFRPNRLRLRPLSGDVGPLRASSANVGRFSRGFDRIWCDSVRFRPFSTGLP